MHELLTILLYVAAALQFAIAGLNLFLPRILGWRDDLARMPLLVREVFHVHSWFISITLLIFAVLTCRFAADLTAPPASLARWLAACIGVFWAIRTLIQVLYYSSTHWRGERAPSVVHFTLLLVYGGMSILYLLCAFRG